MLHYASLLSLLSLSLPSTILAIPPPPPPIPRLPSCTPDTWQTLTPLPSPRQEHSTVALNSTTLAVVGGTTISGTTNLIQLYDIPSNSWRTVAPAPFAVNHPNVASVHGKIYLLGGLADGIPLNDSAINWEATGRSAVYDPCLNTWTALEAMPKGTERGSAITVAHGDVVYLSGGMTVLRATGQDAVSTVTAFNTSSGKWMSLPGGAANLPEARQHGVGAVFRDTLYVLGGRMTQANVKGQVFSLNLRSVEEGWKTAAHQLPTPRGGLSGGLVGAKVYTFGGEGNPVGLTGVFDQTEAFDTVSQEVFKLKAMAVPRHGTSAVAIGGRVYIPGGGLQQDGKAVTVNGTTTYRALSAHFDVYCP